MSIPNITIAITGASGSALAKLALLYLFEQDVKLHVVISDTGRKVYQYETGENIEDTMQKAQNAVMFNNDDLFAPISSGSFKHSGMVILPCSVSTASKIAAGIGDNLICRAASVCIKEKVPLVIVPRETPLSSIVLSNLLTLSQNGVFVMPPVPSFYDKNYGLEPIVGRILSKINIENNLYSKWGIGDYRNNGNSHFG